MITPQLLIAADVDPGSAQVHARYLDDAARRYDIDTPERLRHWLAQVLHESGRLMWAEELSTGAQYEGRADLGNTQPGDGRRYKGRGFIQLTGRANYQEYTNDVGVWAGADFVEAPQLLATEPWASDVAGWFWKKRRLNQMADRGASVAEITRIVNGGYNGLSERQALFAALAPLDRPGALPSPGGFPTTPTATQPGVLASLFQFRPGDLFGSGPLLAGGGLNAKTVLLVLGGAAGFAFLLNETEA